MLLPAGELRLRRQALGLTQAQLAARLGVRANTVARWERGELRPIHPDQVVRRLNRLERAQARPSLANGRVRTAQASRGSTRRTNLPAQLSSFVGRTQELAEVRRLLDSTRLLCLTGPGGIGKTRLAIEVADEVAGDHPDGVCLAELAPVADGDLVARAVARALGVVELVNEPLIETLAAFIGDKHLLLVLDNCEHLVVASAEAAERLLHSCPELRILATSREPLRIGGETVWRVPSLTVPEPRKAMTLEALPQADAVRLFIERARAVAPGFALTEHNARAVVRLCQRLEGIPLALELAAARVPVLSVDQLADRVDDALSLLITGSRVASPRQQTLRATLDWSYGLLSEAEQHLFARLSAFAGGFRLEAAETICTGSGIQHEEVLELLAHLVNKSLVLGETRADGSVRYRLLEPLRQFGAERLRETGDTARVRDCHLDWFLGLANQAADGIWGSHQADWLVWFDQELGNLRAALDWALESGNARLGLRLGASLQYFWVEGIQMAEGRSRLLALLALPSAASDPAAKAAALVVVGQLSARFTGDLGIARSYAEQGLALARQIADCPRLRFEAARALAWAILLQTGDLASADQLFQESLEAARKVGLVQVARALGTLGWARVLQGDLAAGRSLREETVAHFRSLGDQLALGVQLCYLADLDIREGRYDDARQHAREALENAHLPLLMAANWARILDVFIRLAAALNQPERVIRLAGAVSMVRPVVGVNPLTSPELVELAKRELGEANSAELWAEGRAMTVDEIVALALSTPATNGQSGESTTAEESGLTERQRQVLHLLVEGKSNKEIGDALVLSVRTVERHIANLYSRIGAHGRVEATGYAFRQGVS